MYGPNRRDCLLSMSSNMPPSQEPPAIPRREESSPISGQDTTAITEEDRDSDYGKDVQVRIMAGGVTSALPSLLIYMHGYGTGAT